MQIIHGENQVSSREAYSNAKQQAQKQGLNIVEFAGDSLTISNLTQAVESKSLFGSANVVFIENIFSRRPSNEKKQIVDYLLKLISPLESRGDQGALCIWEPKDVSTQLKEIPSHRFDLPKHIFAFLDNPNVSTFHLALGTAPVEQIFASLATRVHKVLLGQGRTSKKIDPLDLLEIDYKQKTSSVPYDLTAALEIWLSQK